MEMMSRVTSFQTSQSMQTEEICILVVHEDQIYSKIMANMLQHCSHYEVLKFGCLIEALTAIGKKKGSLNLVITNIHNSNTRGMDILQYIEKHLNIPVISTPPIENTRPASVQISTPSQLYFVKSLTVNDFKVRWQRAHEKETGKAPNDPSVSLPQAGAVEARVEDTASFSEASRAHQDQNIKEAEDKHDKSEGSDGDDSPRERKQRIIWTDTLHRKFLEAIDILGPNNAFPKKIADVMNVPGLTRENVASHLQKYRRYMKRAQPVQWGINPPTRVTEQSYPPSLSSLINDLQTPSFTPFQPLFSSTNSAASSDSSHSFPPAASTTSSIFSNLGHKEWLKGSSDQGSVQYPYGGSGSSLNQNLLNFETALLISPTGLPQVDLGHAPYNTILPHNIEISPTPIGPDPAQVDIGHAPSNTILLSNTGISSAGLGHAPYNTILPHNIEISPTPTGPGPAQVDIGHAPSNTILPSNTGISSAGLGHALSNTILPSNTEISCTSLGQADLGHASFNTVLPGNAEISSTGLGHVYLGHPPENDILPGNTEPGGSYGDGDQVPSTYVGFRLARDGMSIQAGQKVCSINAEGVVEIADICAEGGKSVVDACQKVLLSGNDDGITETDNPPAEGGDFIEPGEKGFSGNVESIIEHCANLPVEGGKSCEKVFPENGESSKEKDNQLGFAGNGESSIEATNVAAAQGGSSSDNMPPRQQPPLPQIIRDDAEMQLFLDTMAAGPGSPLVFDDLDYSIFDDDSESD